MSEKEKVTQDVSAEAKAKPAKENKPAKAKKDKKPGIGQRMGKFFREIVCCTVNDLLNFLGKGFCNCRKCCFEIHRHPFRPEQRHGY